jgi:putative ATP-dependent endonuclease of OLD family
MKLSSIRIRNFRCIDDLTFNLRDYTSLIGPNNCGKSAVLRAIEVFSNQVQPESEEWRKEHEQEPIVIEGCFDDIQEWERDTPGVAGIVQNNQIRLRATISLNEDGRSEKPVYEAYTRDVSIEGFAERWSDLSPQIQAVAQEIGLDGRRWSGVANRERVRQIVRERYPELVTLGDARWASESISIAPALKQAIPQVVLVPAVRDATDDAKPQARTPFGLLLKRVILPAIQRTDEYQGLMEAVQALTSKLSGVGGEQLEAVKQLADELSQRMSSLIETRVVVTLDPPDTDKFLGSNATIRLDDGTETPICYQGHGAQRALVFALIEVLAKQDAVVEQTEDALRQRSTLLLFEEPELYMHPHLMRRLKTALQSIAASQHWQVVISTHSPFLIDVATDPMSLVIFRRSSPQVPPAVRQLESDPFEEDESSQKDRVALRAALDFHPTVNEVFFARRAVLVEGDTEVAVLQHVPTLLFLAGIDSSESHGVSIISCGGKWTIPPVAKLLVRFEIPFRIIHDVDRKKRSNEELKALPAIHPYRANARIEEVAGDAEILMVEDTFEHLLWDEEEVRPSHDKPYRAWCRVRELCEGVEDLDHAPELREVVRFAFDW